MLFLAFVLDWFAGLHWITTYGIHIIIVIIFRVSPLIATRHQSILSWGFNVQIGIHAARCTAPLCPGRLGEAGHGQALARKLQGLPAC